MVEFSKIIFHRPTLVGKVTMITIRDVAKRLNLSITTVSRALDGYDDVAEETRKLVVQTAQEMGYSPNRAARQLRRQHAETIGFILPLEEMQLSDPFFSEFIGGIGDEVSKHNYDLLVSAASPGSDAETALYRRWVQAGKVDGFIIDRTRLYDTRIQYLAAQKVPFVSLERSLDPVDFTGIETDSRAAILEVMNHLIGMGHDRIAYVGACSTLKINHDRFEGYQDGLSAVGITPDPALVVRGDLTLAGGYSSAKELLDLASPPTAIVCINDLTAIGVMHALHDSGLFVGKDIAVSGFDDISDAAHTLPPLTTFEHPVYATACQLAKMLLTKVTGNEINEIMEKQVTIQPRLVIRPSTGGEAKVRVVSNSL